MGIHHIRHPKSKPQGKAVTWCTSLGLPDSPAGPFRVKTLPSLENLRGSCLIPSPANFRQQRIVKTAKIKMKISLSSKAVSTFILHTKVVLKNIRQNERAIQRHVLSFALPAKLVGRDVGHPKFGS